MNMSIFYHQFHYSRETIRICEERLSHHKHFALDDSVARRLARSVQVVRHDSHGIGAVAGGAHARPGGPISPGGARVAGTGFASSHFPLIIVLSNGFIAFLISLSDAKK